jgi:hypothetical protein
MIDSNREDGGAARKRLLDVCDTEELVSMAGEEAASFRAVVEDLRKARVDPTSAWHTLQFLGNKYVGLLRFHHEGQGDMTLEIPTPNDMQIVLAELPAVFGDHLVVNVELDRCSWQYVAKTS